MSLTGAFIGVLTLAGLEVALDSPRAVGALGGAAGAVQAGVTRLIDPTVGLIPNLHDSSAPTSGSTSTATDGPSVAEQRAAARKLVNLNLKGATARSKPAGPGRKPIVAPHLTKTDRELERLLLGHAPSATN